MSISYEKNGKNETKLTFPVAARYHDITETGAAFPKKRVI